VVGVAHHQCRQNDWKRTHQWRLSFSRAETVLLNSWTPKQQIVYHILRFLLQDSPQIKLSDGKRHKTLSRYHLKTLMMWTCESKHSSWWQPENVVQLSAGLMRRLVIQYKSSNWKGYFVTASNLLECEVSLSVIGQLTAFTEVKYLTDWLIDNYIYKCAKQCLKDTNSDAKLLDVMSSLVEYKQFNSRLSSFINTGKAVVFISEVFSNPPSILDGKDAEKYYEELGQVDNRLQPLFIAMLCLKQINTDDIMSEQTINLLSAFLTKFDQKLRTTEEETSTKSMLHKAIRLMQISVEQSTVDYTSSAILFVLSFIYLRRTKKVDDGDGDVVRRLANVYLAVMYHLAGYYQAALRHCKRVITVHESTHVIDGFTLPKLDDDIDNILGLAVLYQYMRQHATIYLSSLPLNANAVSVQSFTYYLMFLVRLASVNRNDKLHNLLMKRYKFCLLQTSKMFSADFLLFYVATKKWQSADRDVRCIKTFNSLSLKCCAAELRRLLLLLSVEQMTVFRQGIFHDYQSVCNIATSDVEALYAHLCGQYEQCLQMSQKNVSCLWSQTNYFPIPIFGCMLHLMSDDVTSLAALSQLNHFDVTKIYATFHQLTLSLYLVVETKLKLSSPLTSLVKELHRVKELHCRLPTRRVCDRLLLLFIYRKALKKITGHSTNNCTSVNR
jgi:hypothetical protein